MHNVCIQVQEAIEIVDNGTMPEAAKVGALEALQFLLEPIDNANGRTPYSLTPKTEQCTHMNAPQQLQHTGFGPSHCARGSYPSSMGTCCPTCSTSYHVTQPNTSTRPG